MRTRERRVAVPTSNVNTLLLINSAMLDISRTPGWAQLDLQLTGDRTRLG